MNPFAQFSTGLALTLLIWSPTVLNDIRDRDVALASASARFLVIFWVLRVALRSIGHLTVAYRNGPRPVGGARRSGVIARQIHVNGDGVEMVAPTPPTRRKSDQKANDDR